VHYIPTAAALEGRRVLGQQLRRLRQEQKFTQERLALAVGMDRSFYVEVELGRHSLSTDRLCDLADALNVGPADLLIEGSDQHDKDADCTAGTDQHD
jgi:transcriptional regulator with XRE-family HTH domain